MKSIKYIVLLLVIIICYNCKGKEASKTISEIKELTKENRLMLIEKISEMQKSDQKYRNMISLGTTDIEILKEDKKMRNKSIEEYLAFSKTIEKTLSKSQIDSLWNLQHQLDYKNYKSLISIINTYGYPSEKRLQVKTDKAFQILLHPPTKVETNTYLKEMKKLLKPEVLEKRLEAIQFARFVDNIRIKILKEHQLYGTNKSFNVQTMSEGLPKIKNIKETNKARKEIGLQELKEGEYEVY